MQSAQQPQPRLPHVPVSGAVRPSRGYGPYAGERGGGYPGGGHNGSHDGSYRPGGFWSDGRFGPGYGQAHGVGYGPEYGAPFVLVGLDAIGRAVGAGQGAVKRWIREDGFPARRCSDGTYRADPDAVRRWFWITEGAGMDGSLNAMGRSH